MATTRSLSPRFAYKGDRLKPLRAFCQTARLGSVSRAAEALYLSQPAVTLQLQALEREMGVRLLERSGRRLTLTREGQELYELARPLVEGLDSLDGAFRERIRGLDAGDLNVAAGSSTILYLLPKIVEAFRAAHPEVRLTLHNVTGAGGLDLLRSDGVDLAVGSMLDVPGDLSYAPVYRFEPMLITPRDHPLAKLDRVTLQDLSPFGLILPPQRLTTYRMVDVVFQQNRVPYTVALEVGGWEVIKQYVAMGLGISIVT
ncbi:LysR family transcriptional regulator, partial [Lysobacter sp. 2RAB21]